jgi:hypothetical protein
MRQKGFFDYLFPQEKLDDTYSTKITTPIYTPKQALPPRLHELCDQRKMNKMIREIEKSTVSEKEKLFLIEAAHRHVVFNYSKIAEYYCHATAEMQELMERSALVIIDFEKAIEQGYVKLSENIAESYFNDYGDDEQA